MNRVILPRHLRFLPLAAALALAATCAQAQQTLPSGLQVAAGQASAQTQGGVLTVTNSANAILNWQSFSIGTQNAVRFVQPSASSQVLNRVTGSDPSAILGSLSSNGRVWLLNPNGVLFGQGARVDVAGLVTSTLNIANEDWLAGRYVLGGGAAAAGIVNQGEIRTSLGGRVALVGGSVENQGLIEAPGGQVLLAAGRSVELVDTGAPNLAVRITAPQGDVLNLGTLSAAGGRIDVHGAAVNQQGLVRADNLSVGPGGEVVLKASERLTLAAGSVTSADAAAGGGGRVQLLGREVGVLDGASVSASGRDGGGTILAGGDAQGRDAAVPNARALFLGRSASLSADALGRGDGGQIVLWSDLATRAYGALSARGGALGGNGGLIETSGGWLDARPARLDVSAPRGRAGTWLLDPYNITITDGGSGVDTGFDASFTATANDAVITTATLNAALTAGTNVTVSTGTGGTQAGNITVTSANITPSNNAPVTLTLQAAGDIVLDNAQIASSGAPLNVSLESAGSGVGAVSINNSFVSTGGGNLMIGGPGGGPAVGHAGMPDGVKIVAIDLTTEAGGNGPAGNVTINGRTAEAGGRGVFFATDAMSSSNSGSSINNFTVTGSSTQGRGVEINDLTLQEGNGAISITGTGTDGLYITNQQFPQVYLNGASITLTGTSTGTGYGLYMTSDSASSTLIDINFRDFKATGQNTPGGLNALTIMGGGSDMFSLIANLTLTALGGGALLRDLNMTAAAFTSTVELFSDTTLTLDNSSLSANFIHVRSFSTQLLGTTSLHGPTILIEGPANNPTSFFDNKAGSNALRTDSNSSGRWLIWSFDPAGNPSINLGGLDYDFQRYGTKAVADTATDVGSGVASFNVQNATMNGTVAPRAYNGTTQASLSNLSFTLDVAGDTMGSTPSYTANFSSKDVGTRAVTPSFSAAPQFMDATGHPVYGYTLLSAAIGTITPALLSASVSAANKVYDTTTGATVTGSGITGFIGSETVGVAGTGAFANKNVGTGKVVTASYQLSDGSNGGLAANYQFQPPTGNITANITQAPISFSGTAQDKVYDAQPTATLANIVITPLGNDQLTLNTGTATFSDKNVGTGKPVSISGATLTGADAGNYQLVAPTGLAASITPAALTFTATAQSRSYDGTTVAQLTGLGATPLGSDQVTLNAGTGAFADKNVGTGKAVSISGFSLSGADAANYLLAAPTSLAANITPATLAGSVSAANKVYDTTTGATVSVSGITGFIGSETVGVAGTGAFANKNVGTAKVVTASYQLSDGSNGGLAANYQFQLPAGNVTASITPATLTYLADPALMLSGAAFPTFTGTVSGFLGSDAVGNATTGTATYQAGVATSALPGIYAINGSGLSAANYVFVQDSRNAQALQIDPSVSPAQDTAQTGTANLARALQAALPDTPAFTPRDTGLLDMTAPRPASKVAPQTSASQAAMAFGPQPVSDMSEGGLVSLLGARDAYKRSLFAPAIRRLEQDPTLADLPGCRSLQELAEGKCLLTEELKRQAQALRIAAVTGTPSPAAAPAASTPTAAPPAPVAPVAAAPAPATTPDFSQLGKRPVRQAALPQITRKMALLIGAGTYQDPRVPSLANAVGDVRAVGQLLESQLGYETVVIENATRASLIAALNQMAVEAGPHDSVVVYYAGHGELVDAKGQGEGQGERHGYWQLVDSRADEAESWLSNSDITRLLNQIDASQVALISDSCYSGALASGERLRAVPGTPNPATLLAGRSVVVMSSGGNEPVFDSGKDGHSPFAWNLMNTLGKVSGWQPGGNVFERVRFAVARELPQRPQYAAAAGHQQGGDYLFERRQLDTAKP
ncbi:YDG domain-containing protein [Roseateles sp.]|uniref:YDG domain-containing protein n=1 Tax=Roseateles sp. TaxID=1971397 RepID=UPI003267D9AE